MIPSLCLIAATIGNIIIALAVIATNRPQPLCVGCHVRAFIARAERHHGGDRD